MLNQLTIDNFAIIDHLELDFSAGMTVLTGETGAGKSILIDAISLLAGERASQETIRTGKEKASVKGVFSVKSAKQKAVMREIGVAAADTIIIEREISLANKNTIKINGEPATLTDLKALSSKLIDIHSQFDTQRLINPQTYLELLDNFQPDLSTRYLGAYKMRLFELRNLHAEYHELVNKKRELEEKRDIFSFQLQELRQLDFTYDELDKLHEEASTLANFDKVYEQLQLAKSTIENTSLLTNLHSVMTNLARLEKLSQEFSPLHERFVNQYYELEDVIRQINAIAGSLNFDPEHLDKINERVYTLTRISEKYKRPLAELHAYMEELDNLLADADGLEINTENLLKRLNQIFDMTLLEAKKLSQARQNIASRISLELEDLFRDLGLPSARLEVSFAGKLPTSIAQIGLFKDQGIDEIDFLLTTNVGEPLKPLAKTASGGEMSRIMLAFKTMFIKSQQLSTMIFDEIDTGISGKIAKQIADKIKTIATSTQVLAITHVPQVVACGNHHLKVEKQTAGNRTTASARYLDFDERVFDIAAMIAANEPTSSSIQSAKELLMEA